MRVSKIDFIKVVTQLADANRKLEKYEEALNTSCDQYAALLERCNTLGIENANLRLQIARGR